MAKLYAAVSYLIASRKPAEILQGIAGWESAAASRLAGGSNNAAFRVDNDDASAVLKIDSEERRPPFNTRLHEALIQKQAQDAGLAAEVLHADDAIYLTSYVHGAVWTAESFKSRKNLLALAAALQRLHKLPLCGRVFDAADAADLYAENIGAAENQTVAICRSVIAEVGVPRLLCCCHNDLVASNIVSTPSLIMLDWEYACDNDPMFDLATIVEHHELSESQAQTLLHAYAGERAPSYQLALAEQRRLYLALLCLWMLSRDDYKPNDVARVAKRLTTKCS